VKIPFLSCVLDKRLGKVLLEAFRNFPQVGIEVQYSDLMKGKEKEVSFS